MRWSFAGGFTSGVLVTMLCFSSLLVFNDDSHIKFAFDAGRKLGEERQCLKKMEAAIDVIEESHRAFLAGVDYGRRQSCAHDIENIRFLPENLPP